MQITKALDLGCGPSPNNYYDANKCYGIDLIESRSHHVIAHDLSMGTIPFPDNEFDFVTAFDFLEHIPRITYNPALARNINSFIMIMNEVSRILKKGGKFYHKTPLFPQEEAFMDPTHVNYITEKTIIYFAKVIHSPTHQLDCYSFLRDLATSYGITTSFTLHSSRVEGFHLHQVLTKD